MTRQARHLARATKAPRSGRLPPAATSSRRGTFNRRGVPTLVVVALAGLAVSAGVVLGLAIGGSGDQSRTDQELTKLLAGIPQRDRTLGYSRAPVTLDVFADLKDPDSRKWWDDYLPAIIQRDVRTGLLKLRFHSYKTNTRSPVEFVRDQTAALAAAAQNKLWNFVGVFYLQRRNAPTESEFEQYATNDFLQGVARQVPGLDLAQWRHDRHTGRREEQPSEESRAAEALQLHVTPSFRIGRTGGPLSNYSGSTVVKYKAQHPLSYIKASDLKKAIQELRTSDR